MNRSGFTLIELILAIMLLAVVTTTAYMSLTSATRSWRVGTEIADSFHHADYIMEQICMALRSAYYPDSDKPKPEYGLSLIPDGGDDADSRDSISFVKLGSALVGADSDLADTAHRVELSLLEPGERSEPELEQGGLVLRAWRLVGQPEDFDPEDEEFVQPLLLTPGVIGLDFKVLDPQNNLSQGRAPTQDDEIEWIDADWKDDLTNRLPFAVTCTLYFPPPDKHEDPIEVTRIIEIPMAPMSWRDSGAAGGKAKTGGETNKNSSNRKRRPNRNNNRPRGNK